MAARGSWVREQQRVTPGHPPASLCCRMSTTPVHGPTGESHEGRQAESWEMDSLYFSKAQAPLCNQCCPWC